MKTEFELGMPKPVQLPCDSDDGSFAFPGASFFCLYPRPTMLPTSFEALSEYWVKQSIRCVESRVFFAGNQTRLAIVISDVLVISNVQKNIVLIWHDEQQRESFSIKIFQWLLALARFLKLAYEVPSSLWTYGKFIETITAMHNFPTIPYYSCPI